MGGHEEEFPLLGSLGLYASSILGDGNCLFNALSDQLYGHQNEHHTIRSRVIEYMRNHAAYYKQFIDVHPGGGIRRNPKRKNAGAYSSPANVAPPSEADIDRVFEGHLQSMARGGTYGDNMEISAFSSAFDVDVKIYQRDFAYMVSGGGDESKRSVAHIAYHLWEHYSSIRNVDGPHTGLPEVKPRVLSPQEEQTQQEKLAAAPHVLPWMIDLVSSSLPFLADKPTIKRILQEYKGNIDAAVSKLLDAEENGSTSSQQESSSVEREHDTDDDMHDGPNKKQDRRLSRAARAQREKAQPHRHMLSKLAAQDGSQESFNSFDSEASSIPESSQQSTNTQGARDQDWEPRVKLEDSQTSRSESPAKPPVRLKIHGPRLPDPSRAGKTQLKQPGPQRQTARDKKDIKKAAQKHARKEREIAKIKGITSEPSKDTITLRKKTETPPVEGAFRTLYI